MKCSIVLWPYTKADGYEPVGIEESKIQGLKANICLSPTGKLESPLLPVEFSGDLAVSQWLHGVFIMPADENFNYSDLKNMQAFDIFEVGSGIRLGIGYISDGSEKCCYCGWPKSAPFGDSCRQNPFSSNHVF